MNPSGSNIWLLDAVVDIDIQASRGHLNLWKGRARAELYREPNPLSKWLWAGGDAQIVAICNLTTRCYQVQQNGPLLLWALWRLHEANFLYVFLLCKKFFCTYNIKIFIKTLKCNCCTDPFLFTKITIQNDMLQNGQWDSDRHFIYALKQFHLNIQVEWFSENTYTVR